MKYRNAGDILPDKLLRELQKYAAGETLYVPKSEARRSWGEQSGARSYYRERNTAIREKYAAGAKIAELAAEYGLSEDAIRKII